MACPHHHHHTTATTTCCSTCSCPQCFHPPPPPLYTVQSEPLLQALVSLLQPQQNHHLNQTHVHKPSQDQNFATKNHHKQDPNFLVYSLVSRIDALESSLHSFSTASNRSSRPSFTLRDTAARVIQAHFRAFMVHRSRTLRQLKDLAFIKSSLNSLKLSVSKKSRLDPRVISQKAMDLLLELDSFQGGDPMIRDGKRSVSRDLIQFLEYIDGLALKRHKLMYKNAKNLRVLRSNNEEGDDVVNGGEYRNENGGVLVKRQGIRLKANKTVRFAEDGNVYRIICNENDVSSSGDGSLTDECVSSDEHGDVMENLVGESEDLIANLEAMNLNDCESLQSSDQEKNSRKNSSKQAKTETGGNYRIRGGDFVFLAPLPLKMEPKAVPVKKKDGALKIVS